MQALNWPDVFNRTITHSRLGSGIKLGGLRFAHDAVLDFGGRIGQVSADKLSAAMKQLERLTSGECHPQLAFYVFVVTRRTLTLDSYFPITKTLTDEQHKSFYEMAERIILSPGFAVQLLDERQTDIITQVPAIAFLVAGHLAELFYFRTDILEQLLKATCRIRLYTNRKAFANDGGVAGGCYNPGIHSVQLVLSRLFEGFNDSSPGVFPFLHEFGHLLDFLDAGKAESSMTSSGFLPGLRYSDGTLYSQSARELFVEGKRLELDRYSGLNKGQSNWAVLPIGHPYVFQNDTEFIAGYLEMFFRNPHYFAEQNEALYNAFSEVFRQDPRRYWKQDFSFYIEQNRGYYLSGQRPPPAGITIPAQYPI